jgi:hypothetical protein
MMQRQDVLTAVNGERAYQCQQWGATDESNNVGDFVLYMQRELEKARDAYIAPTFSVDEAMAGIRKVTALGVAAMEKFGTGTPRQ